MSTLNMFLLRNKKKYRYILVEKSAVSRAMIIIPLSLVGKNKYGKELRYRYFG